MNSQSQAGQPNAKDDYVEKFLRRNAGSKILEEPDICINAAWGDPGIQIELPSDGTNIFFDDLSNMILPHRLYAIYHCDTKEVEFIYTFLNIESESDKDIANRRFVFHYQSTDYLCEFRMPTERLFRLASQVRRTPGEQHSGLRNLIPFRDFAKKDTLPTRVKEWLENRSPRSFFISPVQEDEIDAIPELCRRLNLYMQYYDRSSPIVVILEEDVGDSGSLPPQRRMISGGKFPAAISTTEIDEFYIHVLESARKADRRYQFVLYYQVIEYAGFHFIDSELRLALRKILRNPAVVDCGEESIAKILSAMTPGQHDDDRKMQSVIKSCCDMSILWEDVDICRDVLSKPIEFDGGFRLDPLISANTTPEAWASMGSEKLFQSLRKIRNAIVHARERRENLVILPGQANDRRLVPYLRLIQRVAEQIAIYS